MHDKYPLITSFVIRFISNEDQFDYPRYRGFVRHIQTGQEISFLNWSEVQAFVQRFIDLQETLPPDENPASD
jgi:hypothetical protein